MPDSSSAPVPATNASSRIPVLEKPHRYEVLDALRGIAAFAVVCFHKNDFFVVSASSSQHYFAHGWLAVDLFFMLSGFVMAFSYQHKLDTGLSTKNFLLLRVVRLYPLALVGTLLGFYVLTGLHHFHPALLGSAGPYLLLLLGLLFLPLISGDRGAATHNAFPYNVPYWSLFSELVANILHSLFLRRRKTSTLSVLCGIFAMSLILCLGLKGNLNFGVKSSEVFLSLLRVAFSYLAGMLLFRLSKSRKPIQVPLLLPILSLLVILALPEIRYEALVEALAVFILFPCIVLFASWIHVKTWAAAICNLLGTISYAIYVLHDPVGELYRMKWSSSRKFASHLHTPWTGVLFLVLLTLLAVFMDRFYDIPVRRKLRRMLQV